MESGGFYYFDEFRGQPGEYVASIPAGLVATQELLTVIAGALALPTYFGFNWNALGDCLRDLGWIREPRVALVHGDLPRIPEGDCRQYLEVLSEASRSWRPEDEHKLRVLFPVSAQGEVARLLGGASRENVQRKG